MTSRLYVEGGGDSKDLNVRCREGFRRLLESAGVAGRMPRIVASGPRHRTLKDFTTAHKTAKTGDFVAMLVDSEEPVSDVEKPWDHLRARDGWRKPTRAQDDQALLMVTSMETWIAADPAAVGHHFGKCLRLSALLPLEGLEQRGRQEVFEALQEASRDCPKPFAKGKASFDLLGAVSAKAIEPALPAFARTVRILRANLAKSTAKATHPRKPRRSPRVPR